MRIVCQKCAAAYAIDDRLISPKGVRAQCPRCRHLQLVKRDPTASSAGAPALGAEPRSSPDNAAAPALGAEPRSSGGAAPPTLSPEPRSGSRPAAAPGARAAPAPRAAPRTPVASADPFADFAAPAPQGPGAAQVDPFADLGVPSSAVPSGDPLLDFLGPAPQELPPTPGAGRTAPAVVVSLGQRTPAPVAASPAQAEATSGCRTCGKPLTDPFDQALGMCDDCRQRAPAPSPAVVARSAPGTDLDLPLLSAPDGEAPSLSVEPRSGSRAAPAPALGAEPRSGARTITRTSHVAVAPARVARLDSGRSKGPLAALVVLLLGAAGAGGYFFVLKPRQLEAGTVATAARSQAVPEAIEAALGRWRLQYLDLSGTSDAQYAEGVALLGREQRRAYAEAEESFQQALLLDPRNDAAVAGYVQSVALGQGAGMDEATFQEARGLVEAAEGRTDHLPALLVAHANLLLTRSRQPELWERARTLADSVLALKTATPAQKAEAYLVLGRAYLSTSKELARERFDSALELAPDLKRVHFYRALAHEAAGEYSLALEKLRKRLELDPTDWDSLAALARIYQEVGEPTEARRLYEARVKSQAGDLRAPLALAVLRYQSEGSPGAAARELRSLLKGRARYAPREVAEVLAHLAAAERTAGNAEAAAKAADEALGLMPNLPEAHLQLLLVSLGRKDAAKARTHWKACQGRLEDGALEKLLEGRVLLLEKKPAEALERFQQSVELDGRRLDAKLLAGVAAAAGGTRRDETFRILFQAQDGDPQRLAPRPAVTRFWLRPEDTLEGTEGVILALGEGHPEDVRPLLYEGLLRFEQGAVDVAERHFKAVLEVDSNNANALAYRSLIALRAGNATAARSLATQAVTVGRQLPVAHLALGLALADARQVEPAKRSLREALRLSQSLLTAQVKLAELEADTHPATSSATLLRVVGLDAENLPAKRLLYLLNQRG
ncbi:zinc-ribbon domain-containing protein [Myxococcaceae bacterium JPH2]|nr:zinc-ribbon domain-containing protein [Myxococcaceae bacterium JPH2]